MEKERRSSFPARFHPIVDGDATPRNPKVARRRCLEIEALISSEIRHGPGRLSEQITGLINSYIFVNFFLERSPQNTQDSLSLIKLHFFL